MSTGPSGHYPLHDLVMRLVEDEINGQTWQLMKLIDKNPRKGIGNIFRDIKRTNLIAGGGMLFLLIDSDKTAEQLGLPARASDEEVIQALREKSDSPEQLEVFFLYENMEDFMSSIQKCAPDLLSENFRSAIETKSLNDRDIVLKEVKKSHQQVLRTCVKEHQPGLAALAHAIAALINDKGQLILP
jgi:hypothetical protein